MLNGDEEGSEKRDTDGILVKLVNPRFVGFDKPFLLATLVGVSSCIVFCGLVVLNLQEERELHLDSGGRDEIVLTLASISDSLRDYVTLPDRCGGGFYSNAKETVSSDGLTRTVVSCEYSACLIYAVKNSVGYPMEPQQCHLSTKYSEGKVPQEFVSGWSGDSQWKYAGMSCLQGWCSLEDLRDYQRAANPCCDAIADGTDMPASCQGDLWLTNPPGYMNWGHIKMQVMHCTSNRHQREAFYSVLLEQPSPSLFPLCPEGDARNGMLAISNAVANPWAGEEECPLDGSMYGGSVNVKVAWTHLEKTAVYTRRSLSDSIADALAFTAYIEMALSVIFIFSLNSFGIIKESRGSSKSAIMQEVKPHEDERKPSLDGKFKELERKLQARFDAQLEAMQKRIVKDVTSQLPSQPYVRPQLVELDIQEPNQPEVPYMPHALGDSSRKRPELSLHAEPQLSARQPQLGDLDSEPPLPPQVHSLPEEPETPEGPSPRPQVRVTGKAGANAPVRVKKFSQVSPQPAVKSNKVVVKKREM
mmetsp:Transcript_4310/g.7557  ORF Transcript_4310/g.7557 Transcript_4310/m.7557 type:complete len:531 (+) Transcript_4310:103-1695(+)